MGGTNILIIGSGGREHAIAWKLKQSKKVSKLFCIPGNGGILQDTARADGGKIDILDFDGIYGFVKENKIDLTIVGPELPLSEGIVDYFKTKNLKIFGPDRRSAQLESSKIFAKEFMEKYNIPTAAFEVFDNYDLAVKHIEHYTSHIARSLVVKADGLAAGKGVFVCDSKEDAEDAVKKIMVDKIFSSAGKRVIIEEKLTGQEASLMALCDGKTILPLVPSQDHKRIFDGDRGPNTGGMGAYAPAKILDEASAKKLIFDNFLRGLKEESLDFKGVIYAGIMLTNHGISVLEFNVRFGDPETQVILPLLKTDLLELILATVDGNLNKCKISWEDGSCVSVVLASGGYPGKYDKGKEIFGLNNIGDAVAFHAGTKFEDNKYLTSGGRVLNVSAIDSTLKGAISKVYKNVEKIKFDGMHFRRDIAAKGL
ncbi:MAG: phosphoribosylamine--glycine ligase [Elusimicrobia bacterium]|nr:phosphoribosylamine--glycine ligase [Elusimicrobiota bacterium]